MVQEFDPIALTFDLSASLHGSESKANYGDIYPVIKTLMQHIDTHWFTGEGKRVRYTREEFFSFVCGHIYTIGGLALITRLMRYQERAIPQVYGYVISRLLYVEQFRRPKIEIKDPRVHVMQVILYRSTGGEPGDEFNVICPECMVLQRTKFGGICSCGFTFEDPYKHIFKVSE
jgi:hypothetical protein